MTNQITKRPTVDISQRKVALTAAIGLLVMALLAPFALFGVLQNLVVPADATATVNNIIASKGLFRTGIAAFLIVIMLDVVVAGALYVLLRPVNRTLALLTAWLRLAFAAVFASALVNLLDVAQLLGGAERSTLQPEQLQAQVMSSIASFGNGWTGIALAIFGLHLFGLGYLLFRSAHFPQVRMDTGSARASTPQAPATAWATVMPRTSTGSTRGSSAHRRRATWKGCGKPQRKAPA